MGEDPEPVHEGGPALVVAVGVEGHGPGEGAGAGLGDQVAL